MRIASLIASSTEIVSALGYQADLVARSHECDYPPSVLALPEVTRPKLDCDGRSYDIDQRVKALVGEGLGVYAVDGETLAALAPDVIVTQIQCEVCAVTARDVEDAVCTFFDGAGRPRPRVVSLEPNALADVWEDIRRVARALGEPARGDALVDSLEARMARVAADVAGAPPVRVACVEWIDPLMAAGNWMPELVARAGGESLFGTAGAHAPWMTFDALAAADPEVILVCPCGFDLQRTRSEMGPLAGTPGWGDLRAVRTGRVVVADGNQYFNRPGPRLVESLEILAEVLHPEVVRYGHEGTGWARF